jgi:hypothetical protein
MYCIIGNRVWLLSSHCCLWTWQAREKLLEELSAKLQEVQLEKQQLQQQNKLLESALAARIKIASESEAAQLAHPGPSEAKVCFSWLGLQGCTFAGEVCPCWLMGSDLLR